MEEVYSGAVFQPISIREKKKLWWEKNCGGGRELLVLDLSQL